MRQYNLDRGAFFISSLSTFAARQSGAAYVKGKNAEASACHRKLGAGLKALRLSPEFPVLSYQHAAPLAFRRVYAFDSRL